MNEQTAKMRLQLKQVRKAARAGPSRRSLKRRAKRLASKEHPRDAPAIMRQRVSPKGAGFDEAWRLLRSEVRAANRIPSGSGDKPMAQGRQRRGVN